MAIKIFIDQGHNPQNPNAGAEANGVREQDVTYDVGVRLGNLLRANPNFEVRLSVIALRSSWAPAMPPVCKPGLLWQMIGERITLAVYTAMLAAIRRPAAARLMYIAFPVQLIGWEN